MVTYTSIIKAINTKIKKQFPDIKLQSNDTEKGLKRPSFRVSADANASNFMGVMQDTKMTVRLYYFPTNKDKYRIELLDMQNALNQMFLTDNIIETDDGFTVQIFELEFGALDGVLHCYFDLEFAEEIVRTDETEIMEDVNIDI